jgi:hypothetical protein
LENRHALLAQPYEAPVQEACGINSCFVLPLVFQLLLSLLLTLLSTLLYRVVMLLLCSDENSRHCRLPSKKSRTAGTAV